MKTATVSELKAKLSRYLRLVKSGEEVEIRDRGIPVARLIAAHKESPLARVPPSKDPASLAKYRFSVKLKVDFDAVDLHMEDRNKR